MALTRIRFFAPLLAVLLAWSPGFAALAEEEEPASKVKSALDERLHALDGEERTLKDLIERLKEGQEVKALDLLKMWLPPALGLVESNRPFDVLELTEDAAQKASDILEEKNRETDGLNQVKSRLLTGEAVDVSDVVKPGELGLDGKLKILEQEEKELEALRHQLEELLFQERFNQAAIFGREREDEGDAPSDEEPDPDFMEADASAGEEEEVKPDIDIQRILDAPQGVDRFALAEALYRTGRYKQARNVYEHIDGASHSEGARILYMIARCRERLEDFQGARDTYQQVEQQFPGSFWSKQSKFALEMVDWKMSFGQIRGVPEEAYRILRGKVQGKVVEGGP